MQEENISYFCDICQKEIAKENLTRIEKMPVMFTTEQNESRPVTPYLSFEAIDLCSECLDKAVKIKASGAMGCNEYWVG